MLLDDKLLIAKTSDLHEDVILEPSMANRHGLIAGATGTGKTVTLKTIAESMSQAGIPVFVSDVKGDVSGMAASGAASEKLVERLANLGIYDYPFQRCPVEFWDVYGEMGAAVRTSISEMGPLLLARLLGLSDVQQGVLNLVFRVADDMGLLLIDLKDLRSMLAYVGEHADEYTITYGNVSKQSIGAIQRALLQLEDEGGDMFFGEPALDIQDWIKTDEEGRGVVNILHCVKLFQSPLLYSTFLLWMLTELYERLPEVGDLDKPKICFFFDEAHLLFEDTADALVKKIVQIVKLIRSKGVGVYFCTQNPADIPDAVLAQLGNRVQHALRAYTPKEQKAIKAAAESFRINPAFDTEEAITELQTGEALISFLDADGIPGIVQRAMVIAPMCSMGSLDDIVREMMLEDSFLRSKYRDVNDPESAYEILMAKTVEDQKEAELAALRAEQEKELARMEAEYAKERERQEKELQKERERQIREYEKERERQQREAQKQREKFEKELLKQIAGQTRPKTTSRPKKDPMEQLLDQALGQVGGSWARGILGMLQK